MNRTTFMASNKAHNATTKVSAKKLLKLVNKALKKADPKGQFDAIKDLITPSAVATLRTHLELTEEDIHELWPKLKQVKGKPTFIPAYNMTWALVNMYNNPQEED